MLMNKVYYHARNDEKIYIIEMFVPSRVDLK